MITRVKKGSEKLNTWMFTLQIDIWMSEYSGTTNNKLEDEFYSCALASQNIFIYIIYLRYTF